VSLAETQAIFVQLQRIDEILGSIESKTLSLNEDLPRTKESVMTLQEATRIAFRLDHILVHMGLPQNMTQSIQILQKFVFMVRMAEMSATLLAGASPYGWIMGTLGAISIMISATEMDVRR
jgi:hypothetical protein